MRSLATPWTLGGHTLPNRVVLAPLADIGNWFVRLQAKRYGAGYAVSEMVSSFGLKYGDGRTHREFLRIHPDEHPMAIQLFGHDAEVMRIAAGIVAEAGADAIDLNFGCPVRKVCKTGAGAALLDDPDKGVAIARAAVEGSGLPVTVKLRSGNARPPLALRAPARAAGRRAVERRDRKRAALGDRARRGAPRGRARGPLPAQVLPLVRRHDGALEARAAAPRHGPHNGRRAGRAGRSRRERQRANCRLKRAPESHSAAATLTDPFDGP